MKLSILKVLFMMGTLLALQTATSTAAPTKSSTPPSEELQRFHGVTNFIAKDTYSLAYKTVVFVRHFLNNDPPFNLDSCFNIKRDNTTDYLTKLAVDYKIAAGYSWYYKTMVKFYNNSLHEEPESLFTYYFNKLNTRTAELQQSIANMARAMDVTVDLTEPTPPTAPPPGKKDPTVVDCTDVCLETVARTARDMLTFITKYVQPDLNGILQTK